MDLRPLIEAKRDGATLTPEQIEQFVAGAASGQASEVHLTAMLMAIFCRGLTTDERTAYALAMMRSGEVLSWDLDRPTADKHSTGGVGDKISLMWAPLMAAVGYAVPMISGRGLGHTGGTLDKLESIPGYRTDLSGDEMGAVLASVGCTITGQTADLVPADRTLYDLRSRSGTVPTVDHIAPSIMSKKLAEGADTLVLDVKVGRGAFMKTLADARQLAQVMVAIGRGAGRNTAALLTSMDRPLGRTVGNAVEVAEAIAVLRNEGPADVTELTVALAAAAIAEQEPGRDARPALQAALADGSALEQFGRMIEAHGGDRSVLDDPSRLLGGPLQDRAVLAERDGVVADIDALGVGLAVADLGGGRGADGSAPHPGVGAELQVRAGQVVRAGEPLLVLKHAGDGLDAAVARAAAAFTIADGDPFDEAGLVIEAVR
jgi:thymidine phosphorylase